MSNPLQNTIYVETEKNSIFLYPLFPWIFPSSILFIIPVINRKSFHYKKDRNFVKLAAYERMSDG
jgi:hypothetical protein